MMNDPLSLHEAEQALQFISADCSRDDWFRVAAALKDEYGAAGFDAFDAWSQTGSSYNKQACKDTFRSAKAGHVRIGSLIKMAVDGGWKRAPMSDGDRQRLQAQRTAERQQREAKAKQETERLAATQTALAAACADLLARHCTPCSDGINLHAYLAKKQVGGVGCFHVRETCALHIDPLIGRADLVKWTGEVKQFKFTSGDLIVPLYRCHDGNITLASIQRIDAEGNKLFPKATPKKGSFLLLGEAQADQPLGFAEGYATAATVHQVMGWPVVVCVDAGNLLPVAQSLAHLPRSATVWLADNDAPNEKTGKQPGQQAALACQKALGGIIALPQFPLPAEQQQDA